MGGGRVIIWPVRRSSKAFAKVIVSVRHQHAAERVRRRIADWISREGRGSRTRLANSVTGLYGAPRTQAWVKDVLDGPDKGGQDLRLRDLDAIAKEMRVSPTELVARDGYDCLEVSASELKLVRYFRSLPAIVQQHMIAYLDFLFAAHEREQVNIEQQRMEATERAKRKGIA